MLTETLDLVAAWPPIRALRGSVVFYPLLSAVHIAGFGTLLGAIATWDVAVLRGRAPDPLAQRIARLGAVVAVSSGLVLFLCRGSVYLGNAAFQIKLALLALALGNVVAAHRVRSGAAQRATAAASVVLWLSVLLAGRYVGFL